MIATWSGVTPDLHARQAVLARGVQQRGQATAIEALGAPLGLDMALVIAIDRCGVDVGALRNQEPHHLGMPPRRRPHQRSLAAPRLLRVDSGAFGDQQPGGFDVAGSRHSLERGHAVRIGRIGIGPRLQQHLQHLGAADFGGQAHRRGAVVVGDLQIGAEPQQPLGLGDVAVVHRPLQRRAAVGAALIDVLLCRLRAPLRLRAHG
jgi:hypothetical protein